jgi:hypothetical protein
MSPRVCRVCDGPRPPGTGCTNGLCADCHRRFCSGGGVTGPGHGVAIFAARAIIAKQRAAPKK